MRRVRGFTLIEVIVTVTIVGIIMLPIAATVIEYIRSGVVGDSIAVATNLAKREIGIINNLPYSDSTLNDGYDHVSSPYLAGYNFDLRRTVSLVTDASGSTSNLKKVVVKVYPTGFGGTGGCGGGGCGGGGCGGGGGGTTPGTDQFVEIDTYVINNVSFGAGSSGGTMSSTEASALSITGGSFSSKTVVANIGMTNTRTTGNITVTAAYVWSNAGSRTLTTIVMWGSQTVYSGSLGLPTSKPASPNLTLQRTDIINYSATADTANSFTFSTNFAKNDTFNVVYRMSDGTDTGTYKWTY